MLVRKSVIGGRKQLLRKKGGKQNELKHITERSRGGRKKGWKKRERVGGECSGVILPVGIKNVGG